jgi:hypothetical protein
MSGEVPGNAIGDSFLNSCTEIIHFFASISDLRTTLLGWNEPYPLVTLILILLIILPSIFRFGSKNSYLKISRVYNFTRLGIMSLLHQITYVYTLAMPVSLMIGQGTPCVHASTYGTFIRLTGFPSTSLMSASLFGFSVARFSGAPAKFLLPVLFVYIGLTFVAELDAVFVNLFQAIASVLMSYVLHFIHIHIPFRFIHVENIVLALLTITAAVFSGLERGWTLKGAFINLWFSFVVILIDELMLIRHQWTRGGFAAIERPVDISWRMDMSHVESIRLLNSEEESSFLKNLQDDITTSAIAFLSFALGVVVRRLLQPVVFATAS